MIIKQIPKDEKEYTKEREEFEARLKEGEESLIFPSLYKEEKVEFSKLKVDQIINIETKEDAREKKELEAVKVIILSRGENFPL